MSKRYANTVKKMLEFAAGRELVMWGSDALTHYIYEDILKFPGGGIKYFIDDMQVCKEYRGVSYKKSIELFLENKEEIYIIAFVIKGHADIYQKLVDMAFEPEKDFYIGGIAGYQADYDVVDAMLGYNRYYGETLGFQIYGNIENEHAYRIMTLGGSTTDPTEGNNKSWPEQLYEGLRTDYPDIVVINGGLAGYASNMELLKLIRDGLRYKPDMLLTFDGFNDVNFSCVCENYPLLHPYAKKTFDRIEKNGNFAPDTLGLRSPSRLVYGMAEQNADYEIYIRNLRMIHSIAEEFGMIHIGFLQPMFSIGKPIIDEESDSFYKEITREYAYILDRMQLFKENVALWLMQKEYMHDLTPIFDNKPHMYYDICHATDEGNAVIAQNIEIYVRERMVSAC